MVIDLTTATGRPSQTKAAWAVYDSTWLAAVVSRVTAANGCGSAALDAKGTPYHRPLRLGPRLFTISVLKSLGGISFGRHLFSRTNFKPNRAGALFEYRQLLSA